MKRKTGPTTYKRVAKSAKAEPEALVSVPPVSPEPKRGRPRKNLDEKVLTAFQRAMGEQELAITDPMHDGGGTSIDAPVIEKAGLERRVARRLNVIDRFLTDERLIAMLGQSSLKEVGIYEGIMLDKALVLKGQPTVIVGSEDRANADTVLPKLLAELRRRKLTTTVSERKIEFTGTD